LPEGQLEKQFSLYKLGPVRELLQQIDRRAVTLLIASACAERCIPCWPARLRYSIALSMLSLCL
jgi:hypothetical protein